MAKLENFSEPPKANQMVVDSESDSDSDQENGLAQTDAAGSGRSSGTVVIHSGHFMVSSPHSDPVTRSRKTQYDFDTVNKPRCQTYSFGPFSSRRLSIDPTLTRLFECMTLAYSGKIVSPKWKSFKGLRLLWRDKIRLNNGIWRAWFIQYVEKRKNPVCGFVTPLEGSEADAHRKPEAIVLEGSYWKRRIEVVIKEYHKWRIYYKKRKHKDLMPSLQKTVNHKPCRTGLEKWSDQMYPEPEANQEEVHMFDLDCFLSDISDTLFTMTQKPSPWSGERHNTYTSNADMIQPGLTPLQPNLDDLMDIPDIFASYRGHPLQSGYADFSLFEGSSSASFPSTSSVVNAPIMQTGSQILQPDLTVENLPQPSSAATLPSPCYLRRTPTSEMPFDASMASEPKFKSHLEYSEYPLCSGVLLCMDSYGQSLSGPGIDPGIATESSNLSSASMSQDNLYQYPSTCLKYRHSSGHHSGGGAVTTQTVITHTGSMNVVAQDPQEGQCYAMLDMMGYKQTSVAPFPPSHCFSVPQQVPVGTGRGRHKQKMGSIGLPAPPAGSVGLSSQTSCLARLLSSSSQEQKPPLGFDAPCVGSKGHRPTSPMSAQSTSSMPVSQRGSQISQHPSWPPAEVSLQCQALMMAQPSVSHGSCISSLLIPKTEKLSPIKIHTPERTSLTVNFSGNFGPTSPTITSEKASESLHTSSGIAKTEPNRPDTRRITHISAEQKRRFNIKLGFDTLQSLVTTLNSQPSIKISKATTLQKTAEYISKMQQERAQLHEEAQRLRDEIQALNSAITVCQQQLPATGVPITRQRFDHMREKFREYVRAQTVQNWKFWIFSVIMEPLFESYNVMVSTASVEEMCRTTLSWLDQHCSLPALRPTVLSSLRLLSTTTSILTDPSLVPEQATQAVNQGHPSYSCNQ
ncbi:carbohydrate-responsive element-binding protein-like [Trichomycterus rosablanca]|uniref:carbohydrate-responsive element-binding protein-like n=1 Tax=Trichomycterus rosablanca TaxID=2290929 RepID=UPI002F354658